MIRFTVLVAATLIATGSLAHATTPATPLAPLSPTKDKSVQPDTAKPVDEFERQRSDSRRKAMKRATIRSQSKNTEQAAPETGTKGRVHTPSKAVKHEPAKDPANQKAPAAP